MTSETLLYTRYPTISLELHRFISLPTHCEYQGLPTRGALWARGAYGYALHIVQEKTGHSYTNQKKKR